MMTTAIPCCHAALLPGKNPSLQDGHCSIIPPRPPSLSVPQPSGRKSRPSWFAGQTLPAPINLMWANFLRPVALDLKIIVYCMSQSSVNTARSYFQSQNVPIDSMEFVIRQTDTWWIRDYGPSKYCASPVPVSPIVSVCLFSAILVIRFK